jgi:uridine kinase
MIEVSSTAQSVLAARRRTPAGESTLVALSGIDGAGKGYVAGLLAAALEREGLHAVEIHADGWLNLPSRRFDPDRPAEHFYEHAIRFGPMFAELVLPLKRSRSIRVTVDLASETSTEYTRHTFDVSDVDVIVLEGVYLLKRAFRGDYDRAVWVECSFETALERALDRKQEGLSPAETIRAYRTIYFPAEEIHFRRDAPQASADEILVNDPRLAGPGGPLDGVPPGSSSRTA